LLSGIGVLLNEGKKGDKSMEINPIKTVADLFSILPIRPFRKTKGVSFDIIPAELFKNISSADRVIHHASAVSPGRVGDVIYPWYMHPSQSDNLLVLYGTRHIDLYTPAHGQIENFIVTPESILQNGKLITREPAMLVWPKNVFHRVRSDHEGSASINFAVHHEGFDIKTNFSIYDVNTDSGEFKVIREGHKDQF
jgi:hypothetical protein